MGIQRRKRQGLVDALKRGMTRDVDSLPARPVRSDSRKPLNQVELDRQEKIKNHRNVVADELGIDPTLIATRSHVASLARDSEAKDGLLGWQKELLEPILQVVDSESD